MSDNTKEIRVRWADAQVEAVGVAAAAIGLSVSAYTKLALLERMARDGIHPSQPKDHA